MSAQADVDPFLVDVKQWAEALPDITAVLLVGSYARGSARVDSDVDLVILTTNPQQYVASVSFAEHFGTVLKSETEDWGRVISQRIWYQNGLEVEFGFALPDWASRPLDEGTRNVISNGAQIVFDRDGSLSWLVGARRAILGR